MNITVTRLNGQTRLFKTAKCDQGYAFVNRQGNQLSLGADRDTTMASPELLLSAAREVWQIEVN